MGRGTDPCTRCNADEWGDVAEALGGICAECAAAEIKRLRAALRLACTPPWQWTDGTELNVNALIVFYLRMVDLQKKSGGDDE